MPEQHRGVRPKVLPHRVEVVEVGRERNVLGPDVLGGSPARALIVVDEAELILELIQLRQEVTVVEIGPAVEDDDRPSLPNRSGIERRRTDRVRLSIAFTLLSASCAVAECCGNAVTSDAARVARTK